MVSALSRAMHSLAASISLYTSTCSTLTHVASEWNYI